MPDDDYAYLLAMYLGDGTISCAPRGVYRLRIVLDSKYPRIIEECRSRVERVMPGRRVLVQNRRYENAAEIGCYSKHWLCLFPQHGKGLKHTRSIRLESWQERIAARYPQEIVRGFIHSDGTRHLNRVNGVDYPRYMFTNHSSDIRRLFCDACDRLGVRWTQSYWKTISIARRSSVAILDTFVGPKK